MSLKTGVVFLGPTHGGVPTQLDGACQLPADQFFCTGEGLASWRQSQLCFPYACACPWSHDILQAGWVAVEHSAVISTVATVTATPEVRRWQLVLPHRRRGRDGHWSLTKDSSHSFLSLLASWM